MEQKVTDIGVLEFTQGQYGGYFTAKKLIRLFSASYEINIRFKVFHHGMEGLTDEMVMAAKACLDAINNQTDKIEQAIKNYYDTEVKADAEEGFCNYVKMDDISQLAQVATPEELFVEKLKTMIVVGLYFVCDWSEEKGFGIRFDTEGNIIELGTGEIIY